MRSTTTTPTCSRTRWKGAQTGNYVLKFALPDGNHAQFEWTDESPAKGKFWLKDTEKPITETAMHRVHWKYGHEESWPYKGDPKEQSPIELPEKGGANQWPGQYGEADVASVKNNGHAFQLDYKEDGGVLEMDQRGFLLKQFHFHSPSEHKQTGYAGFTDEDGNQYPGHYAMEVHFVHSAGFEGNPLLARLAPQRKDLAVVGVFIKEGAPNEYLEAIMDQCPETEGKNLNPGFGQFDASWLMPEGSNYQTYKGSLTTPPLSSGASWFVMDQPIEASREQIERFRAPMRRNTNRSIQGRLNP